LTPGFARLWINAVATEKQIEQAYLDQLKFPPMAQMRDDIKQAYFGYATREAEFAVIVDKFFELLKTTWIVTSSYTHSGGRQIARRFSGDEVTPNYSDHEVAQALSLATLALMLLMRMFFMSMGKHPEANETQTLLMQYLAWYNDRG
jgi:hypothetical protein